MNQNENLHAGDCIRTFTGKYLDVFNPDPEMICIEDIANGLSQMPRFAGQLKKFYSVAEHSYLCSLRGAVPNAETRMALLLHDASEAYLCDIPKPIKKRLPDYQKVEENLMRVIAEKFGVEYPFNPIVKEVDKDMLRMEFDCLALLSYPPSDFFQYWSPDAACAHFLARYQTIKKWIDG